MTGAFSAVDVIRAKRDHQPVTDEQIDWVVAAYTRGHVAEEQMAALAMAILLQRHGLLGEMPDRRDGIVL